MINYATALEPQIETLPALIDRAALALTNARSSAEVLEARDMANFAYHVAKTTARLLRAKQAHDDLVSAAYLVQGDALLIENQAKIRLVDEYDAAKKAGKVAPQGQRTDLLPEEKKVPTVSDLGLSHKDIHEARQIRDAEQAHPGVVREVINEKVRSGSDLNKAAVREAVRERLSSDRPTPAGEAWSPEDIQAPRQAPAITGDPAVFHAIEDVRRAIEPLGDAAKAMRRFSPQLRHAVSAEILDTLAEWFATAAAEWRVITGGEHVAAE
jgi:hypothetical protein